MQKLGQERQIGRQLESLLYTPMQLGWQEKGKVQLKRIQQLEPDHFSLCRPHTPPAAGAIHHYHVYCFLWPLGGHISLVMFSRQIPVVLFRRPSVLEVMRLTARCSSSCLLVKGAPQSFPAWERPTTLPEVSGKGIWSTNRDPMFI